MNLKILAAAICVIGVPAAACAQSDPYRITATEKAACIADATRLCANTYPDEEKLLACMQASKASLSKGCLVVFNAGLKRRALVAR